MNIIFAQQNFCDFWRKWSKKLSSPSCSNIFTHMKSSNIRLLIHGSEAAVLEFLLVLTIVVKLLSRWVRESCVWWTMGWTWGAAVLSSINGSTCPFLAITLTRLREARATTFPSLSWAHSYELHMRAWAHHSLHFAHMWGMRRETKPSTGNWQHSSQDGSVSDLCQRILESSLNIFSSENQRSKVPGFSFQYKFVKNQLINSGRVRTNICLYLERFPL